MRIADIFNRPFAFAGRVWLNSHIANLPDEDGFKKAKIAHEVVHIGQMGGFVGHVVFLSQYVLFTAFRLKVEKEAYLKELSVLKENGLSPVGGSYTYALIERGFKEAEAEAIVATYFSNAV
jgi:hypothetical protein